MGNVGEGNIFGFTSSKTLADLGWKPYWTELELNLSASGIEDVWIKDEASLKLMDTIRSRFDLSSAQEADILNQKVLHPLAFGGNEDLMRRLLSLGLNPDVVVNNDSPNTPSHTCSLRAFAAGVELLALCRANAAATNGEGRTPAERAEVFFSVLDWNSKKSSEDKDKIKRFHKIRAIWDVIRLFGPPSLAQLASNRQWWAVKNLCRRKAVDLDEVLAKYRGKDAVEWALFHGADDLADEIKYLFGYPASDQSSGSNQDDTKGMLQELVVTFGERVSAFEEEIETLNSRMRAVEERNPAGGPSIKHQSHETGYRQRRSMVQSGTVLGDAGGDPVLQAMDMMWREIRSEAVNSDRKLTTLSKLGVLLEELKRA